MEDLHLLHALQDSMTCVFNDGAQWTEHRVEPPAGLSCGLASGNWSDGGILPRAEKLKAELRFEVKVCNSSKTVLRAAK